MSEVNKKEIKKLVIDLITDENIKVRNTGCIALTSLIHSKFVQVEPKLIVRNILYYVIFFKTRLLILFFFVQTYFTELSNLKSKKKEEGSDKYVLHMPYLIKKHGGILGLCSIINAFPYDIPDYLPEILTHTCQFINEPAPINVIGLQSLTFKFRPLN